MECRVEEPMKEQLDLEHHSLIHLFSHQIFTEGPLYFKHCANCLGTKQHAPSPHTAHITQGRQVLRNKHTQKYNDKTGSAMKAAAKETHGDISVIVGSGQDWLQ